MEQGVRKRGFYKFCIGLAGAIAVGFFHNWLDTRGYALTIWGLMTFGIPGAYGASGLLELITGIPFTSLAAEWDDLKGWQRGVIGFLVVALCLGALVGGLAIWGSMTM